MDPKDDVEREERRGVLWFTVMMDVSSAAMSGWGTSLVMDEIVSFFQIIALLTIRCSLCLLVLRSGRLE